MDKNTDILNYTSTVPHLILIAYPAWWYLHRKVSHSGQLYLKDESIECIQADLGLQDVVKTNSPSWSVTERCFPPTINPMKWEPRTPLSEGPRSPLEHRRLGTEMSGRSWGGAEMTGRSWGWAEITGRRWEGAEMGRGGDDGHSPWPRMWGGGGG